MSDSSAPIHLAFLNIFEDKTGGINYGQNSRRT